MKRYPCFPEDGAGQDVETVFASATVTSADPPPVGFSRDFCTTAVRAMFMTAPSCHYCLWRKCEPILSPYFMDVKKSSFAGLKKGILNFSYPARPMWFSQTFAHGIISRACYQIEWRTTNRSPALLLAFSTSRMAGMIHAV